MNPKEKALFIYNKFNFYVNKSDFFGDDVERINTIGCCLIAIENEYNSKRELLFSLRVNKTIDNEKVYLSLIDELIKEEQDIKSELEKL